MANWTADLSYPGEGLPTGWWVEPSAEGAKLLVDKAAESILPRLRTSVTGWLEGQENTRVIAAQGAATVIGVAATVYNASEAYAAASKGDTEGAVSRGAQAALGAATTVAVGYAAFGSGSARIAGVLRFGGPPTAAAAAAVTPWTTAGTEYMALRDYNEWHQGIADALDPLREAIHSSRRKLQQLASEFRSKCMDDPADSSDDTGGGSACSPE